MIVKLSNNSTDINQLEIIFSKVLKQGQIQNDINNNQFANYFLYLIDDRVVGFIHYDIMYERAELININILKEYQNQKIATELIKFMINDCMKHKVKSITLEVRKDNEIAIHLYKKYGFLDVSIRKGYYQGIDGILMEKELM